MNGLFEKFLGYYLVEVEKVRDFFKKEEGQTLVEYALILVLIAIVVLLMLSALGGSVCNTFNTVNSALSTT